MQEQEDGLILKQHHEMIVMKPEGLHRVTLIGRRLYSALIAQTQMELNGQIPLATKTFEAPLKDLLVIAGSSGEARSVAKKYFQEMQDLKVTWESTSAGDGVKWIGLSMLSQAKIYVERGQTWLSWAFPPEIITMIVHPDRYAVWNLQITAKLGTYSALALYEICARYRDNPGALTSRKNTEWWIDALSNTAPAADKKRREWRKFKLEKVNAAIAEINAETDLEIELIEHKEGRAVSDVQFGVRKKKMNSISTVKTPVDTTLIARAAELSISEPQVESLIRTYGDAAVLLKLSDLADRIRDRTKGPLGNNFAYLKVILKNLHLVPQREANQEPIKAVVVRDQLPLTLAATVQTLPDMLIEQTTQKIPIVDEAKKPTIQEIRAEVEALSEQDRKYWIEKAAALLKSQGRFTAIHQKRLDENKLATGMLAGVIVNMYAHENYGIDF